jgi:hypothetical protein
MCRSLLRRGASAGAPSAGPVRSEVARRGRRGGSSGQASVEHAAIVLVVLLVLVVGATVAGGASIVNAVHSGIRRAICVAGGDRCAPFHVPQPCLVVRDDQQQSSGASFLVFRIGGSEGLTVERRSDGSVTITAYRDLEAGIGLSVGASFGLGRTTDGDGGLVAAGGDGRGSFEASAGVEGRLRGGWGQRWELPDGRAADDFLRRYVAMRRAALPGGGGKREAEVPPPDVERVRFGADGSVSGEVSGPLGLAGSARAMVGLRGSGARDRRTGRTTVGVAVPAAIAGVLSGPLGLEIEGDLRVESSVALVLDRELRPEELRLLGRATTAGDTREREVQLRLDLTRPELAREVGALLRGLRDGDPAAARGAAARLGRWAAAEGWVDEREYRVETAGTGREGELALGLRLGFHECDQRSRATLVAARSRPPGGIWEAREDCVRGGPPGAG